ncbi:MAG: succinate dehydrogenase (or fumarate reductase) cytochrome b subunit, b558 family [Armatimonadetes bacterium]|jgi:succinate dehydrogenase / fumarate reductase cytochrome b subunit|nr:succinate dehydrogenase (or fumarate reductase) cytochrome b subunit, b558 family [Armatimonadota bacterium]
MRKSPLSSSTGTKFLMALSGLALIAFLVFHLAGNLLVFAGEKPFNTYAKVLGGNPVLVNTFELSLLALFLFHIYKAVRNYQANRNARPVPYHKKEWAGGPSRKSAASSTMIVTGTLMVVFIVIHLKQFKFGGFHDHPQGLYGLEMATFSEPLMVLFYVVSLTVIAFHVWHGLWSAFQSLGIGNARYTPRIALLSKVVAVLIACGFVTIPIWAYFVGSK